MKHLWTEHTQVRLHFWKLPIQLFFNDALVVESKESNQLSDAYRDGYESISISIYILFDYVVDNQDIRNKSIVC